jgi:hypothetical protein
MKYGTCYFPSYGAAMRYYRPYAGQIVRGAQIHQLRAFVDQKLNAREIHIGKPPLKPGETLSIEDNRWHVTEPAKPLTK